MTHERQFDLLNQNPIYLARRMAAALRNVGDMDTFETDDQAAVAQDAKFDSIIFPDGSTFEDKLLDAPKEGDL